MSDFPEIPIEPTLNERVLNIEQQLAIVDSILELEARLTAIEHYLANNGA